MAEPQLPEYDRRERRHLRGFGHSHPPFKRRNPQSPDATLPAFDRRQTRIAYRLAPAKRGGYSPHKWEFEPLGFLILFVVFLFFVTLLLALVLVTLGWVRLVATGQMSSDSYFEMLHYNLSHLRDPLVFSRLKEFVRFVLYG